jgi:hypothetical protein
MVRTGVVTAIPRLMVTSSGRKPGTRWMRSRGLPAQPPAVGTVTSILAAALGRSSHSAAAAAWLSAAPGPPASTAAIQWPSRRSTG